MSVWRLVIVRSVRGSVTLVASDMNQPLCSTLLRSADPLTDADCAPSSADFFHQVLTTRAGVLSSCEPGPGHPSLGGFAWRLSNPLNSGLELDPGLTDRSRDLVDQREVFPCSVHSGPFGDSGSDGRISNAD